MRNQRDKISALRLSKTIVSLMLALMLLCGNLTSAAPGMLNALALEVAQTPAPTQQTVAEEAATPQTEAPVEPSPLAETPTAADTSATDKPAEEAAAASESPATDVPATDVPETDTSATDAPAADTPATDTPATDAPVTDERSPLQRAIENESGAYVDVQSGKVYENQSLNKLMGVLDGGLAFATEYNVRQDDEDSVCVIFRTSDDSLLTGYIPASCATECNRQETIDQLTGDGVTFLFKTEPDLPLSVIGFTYAQDETEQGDSESDSTEDEAPAIVVEEVEPYVAAAVQNKVNLRKQPSTDAPLMAQLDKGVRMTVRGKLTDAAGVEWYYVTYNHNPYYVMAELVEAADTATETPADMAAPADEAQQPGDAAGSSYADAPYVGELPNGVTANGDDYYTYTAPDGTQTLLAYGSVNGGAPAFYAVDEYENMHTDAPFAVNAPAPEQAAEPEEGAAASFVQMDYTGDLAANITANGDGYYTYTASDGTQTLLIYGSANDGEPAFYAVDEYQNVLTDAPFNMEAPVPDLTVEPDEEEADPFVQMDYTGDPIADITANGDGYYTYTAPDGTILLLIYGSANDGEPAFYAVDENMVINLTEPFTLPAEAAPAAQTAADEEIFTPLIPDSANVPEYYLLVSAPPQGSAKMTAITAALNWLLPRASAEATNQPIIYSFTVDNVDGTSNTYYRAYGKVGDAIGFYAWDNEANDIIHPATLVNPQDDFALMNEADQLIAIINQLKALPTLARVQELAANQTSDNIAAVNSAKELANTINGQITSYKATQSEGKAAEFDARLQEQSAAGMQNLTDLVAYFAQLDAAKPVFTPVAFAGELPVGVTDNGDGFFSYSVEEGIVTLLAYGTVNGGEPAFYAVGEDGEVDTSAPFEWRAGVEQTKDGFFIQMTPSMENLPDFYKQREVTSPEVISFLRFLVASARAEEDGTEEDGVTVHYFEAYDGAMYYRRYGVINNSEGYYASDVNGVLLDPIQPVDIFEDARLFAGNPYGLDESLVVRFTPLQTTYKTGSVARMRLEASLASAKASEFSNVKIQLPAGFTFSQFPTNGSSIKSGAIDITRVDEGGISYLTFKIKPGQTISNCYINVQTPNGITESGTEANYNITYSKDFTGVPTLETSPTVFTAGFGWEDVDISGTPGETSYIAGPKLKDDISYVVTAHNIYNGNSTGVIFTNDYTLTGTIDLPTGLTFITGEQKLADGGKTITIGGVPVATFDKPIQSFRINSNNQLVYTYQKTNDAVPTKDLENVDLSVKLLKDGIKIDGTTIPNTEGVIKHSVDFQANPYQNYALPHHSTDDYSTTIPGGLAKIKVEKDNVPNAAVVLYNKGKDANGTDGDTITYTLTVSNLGASNITVNVVDPIPAGVAFVAGSTTPAGGVLEGGKVVWKNQTINGGVVGKKYSFQVKLTNAVENNTIIPNQATVVESAKTTNVLATSNQVTNTYTLDDKITLLKTIGVAGIKDSVYYNDIIPYTLTVTNKNATKDSAEYTIKDTLPEYVSISVAQLNEMQTTYPGSTYDAATRTVTIPVPAIKAGESKDFIFSVTMPNGKAEEGSHIYTENDPIVNNAELDGVEGTQTSATTRFHEKIPTLLYEKSSIKQQEVSHNNFEIDYAMKVTNSGFDTSELITAPLMTDTMTAGLKPYGAGDNTAGTITVTLDDGTVVPNCTWTRSATKKPVATHVGSTSIAEAYEYYVSIPLPSLGTDETRTFYYKAEASFSDEEFAGNAILTVWNDVTIPTNSAAGTGSAGIGVDLARNYSLRKAITNVNGVAPVSDRQSTLCGGDLVTYTITITNKGDIPTMGLASDELPVPKTAGFTWVMGGANANVIPVSLTSSDGTTYSNDGFSFENNTLLYKDAILPARTGENPGTLTMVLQLKYPADSDDGTDFTVNFGAAGDRVTNSGYFFSPNPFVSMRDSVIHTVVANVPTVDKTQNKTKVDSAADSPAEDRTVIYTISGFDTIHSSKEASLLDDLTDLHNKLSIDAFSLGAYRLVDLTGTEVTTYTVDLSYTDGTSKTITVNADGTTDPLTLMEGKTANDVQSIKWNFGANANQKGLRSFSVLTAPTITAQALEDEIGKVVNTVNMSYNNQNASAEVTTTVTNKNLLNKVLYDADNLPIDNDTNRAAANEELTYVIKMRNMSGAPIPLNTLTLTDKLRYEGIDQTYNAGAVTLETTHTTQYGDAPISPAAPATQTIAFTAMTNGTIDADNPYPFYEYTIPFTGGVLEDGDTLTVTYKVRTSADFLKSCNGTTDDEKNSHMLYNYVSATWTDMEGDALENTSGPFAAKSAAYVDFKKGLVGTFFNMMGNYGGSLNRRAQRQTFANFHGAGNGGTMNLAQLQNYCIETSTNDNSNIRQPADNVFYSGLVYGVALVNSAESTTSIFIDPAKFAWYDEGYILVGDTTRLADNYVDCRWEGGQGEYFEPVNISNGYYMGMGGGYTQLNTGGGLNYIAGYNGSLLQANIPATTSRTAIGNGSLVSKMAVSTTDGPLAGGLLEIKPGEAYYAAIVATKNNRTAEDVDGFANTAILDLDSITVPEGATLEVKDQNISFQEYTNFGSGLVGAGNPKVVTKRGDTAVNGTSEEVTDYEVAGESGVTVEHGIKSTVSTVITRPKIAVQKEWVGSYAYDSAHPFTMAPNKNNPYDGQTMDDTTVSPDNDDHIVWNFSVKNTSTTNAVLDYAEIIETMPKEYRPTYLAMQSNMTRDGNPVAEDLNIYSFYDNATSVATTGLPKNLSLSNDGTNTTLGINLALVYPVVQGNAAEYVAFQGGYKGALDTGVTDLRLAPGEELSFTLVMQPIQGETIQYVPYKNTVEYQLTTPRDTNGFSAVSMGSPLKNDNGNLIGATADGTVSIGGVFGSLGAKTVTQNGVTKTTEEKNKENRVLTVDENNNFTYDLIVTNTGDYAMTQMTFIDRLPAVGDHGVINNQVIRNSAFDVLAGNGNYTVKVSADNGVNWTDVTGSFAFGFKTQPASVAFTDADINAGASTGWTATPTVTTNAVRVYTETYSLAAHALIKITFEGKVSEDAELPEEGEVAWNNYAYAYMPAGGGASRIKAEPGSVGVTFEGIKLALRKMTDADKPLAGSVFGVYKTEAEATAATAAAPGTPVLTLTSGTDGYVCSENAIRRGTYYVKELSTNAKYTMDSTVYTVNLQTAAVNKVYNAKTGTEIPVDDNNKPTAIDDIEPFTNILTGAKIALLKTGKDGIDGTKPLSGAVFEIYNNAECNGNPVATLTTDANGQAVTATNLPNGKYWVREKTPPAGYMLNSSTKYAVDLSSATLNDVYNAKNGSKMTLDVNGKPVFDENTPTIYDAPVPYDLVLTKTMKAGSAAPTGDIKISITGVFTNTLDPSKPDTRVYTFTPDDIANGVTKTVTGLLRSVTGETPIVYTLVENDATYQMTATAGVNTKVTATTKDGQPVFNSFDVVVYNNGSVGLENYAPKEDETGKLSVQKIVKSADGTVEPDNDETFEFTVSGDFHVAGDWDAPLVYKSVQVKISAKDGAVEIPNVAYGQTYMVTETSGGTNYTVTYTRDNDTGDAVVGVPAANGAVTVQGTNMLMQLTNTRKAPGKMYLKKQAGEDTTLTEASYKVTVTGDFSDGTTSKTLDVPANGTPVEVPNVQLDKIYTAEEAQSPKYVISYKVGAAAGNAVTIYGQGNDQTITIVNTKAAAGSLKLSKQIEENSFKAFESFEFELQGPAGADSKTYIGKVTTNSRGIVAWTLEGVAVKMDNLPFGDYTLKETKAGTNYIFKSFSINGATPTTAETLSFTLSEANAILEVEAVNTVKTGSFRVDKAVVMANEGTTPEKAAQTIYIGLYESGKDTPVVKELEWDDAAHAYKPVVFENVPYGNYSVYELISDGGTGYVKARTDTTFNYTVTGEGDVALNNTNAIPVGEQGTAVGTITNKQKSTNATITVNKEFNTNASMESLADKTFTVILKRTDGNINKDGAELKIKLTYDAVKKEFVSDLTSDVLLPLGKYEFWEDTTAAATEGWENTALSGKANGVAAQITSTGTPAVYKGSFEITSAMANTADQPSCAIILEATNKSLLKKLKVELSKEIDSLNIDPTKMVFDFDLYHKSTVTGTPDEKIATVQITKTQLESEIVSKTAWKKADGLAAFDIDNYLWIIGDTYYIKEQANALYKLDSVTGGTAYNEGTGADEHLVGVSFQVSEGTNSLTLGFKNTQNKSIGVTLQKKVMDGENEVPVANWPTGTEFTFGVFVNDNHNTEEAGMRLISTVTLTNGTVTELSVPETDKLLEGGTYFIKELSCIPEGGYALDNVKVGATELTSYGDYYAFTAVGGGTRLALVATNAKQSAALTIKKIRSGGTATGFTFTVTIAGTAYKGDYTLYANDEDHTGTTKNTTNGVITLNTGERATIAGLYVGQTYTVLEAPVANYAAAVTVQGEKVEATTGETGTSISSVLEATNTVVYTNTLQASSITLTKTVVGNAGDRSAYYKFKVTLPATAGISEANKSYTINLENATKTNITYGGATVTNPTTITTDANGAGSCYVYLKHGESLVIENLPIGAAYEFVENDAVANGVVVTHKIGTAEAANGDTATSTVPTNGETVAYTNTYDITVPTGILLDFWPYLLIVLVAIAGGVWLLISKRKKNSRKQADDENWQ